MTVPRIRLKYLAAVPITNGLGLSGTFDDPTWPRYVRTTDICDERTLRDDVFASQPPDIAAGAMLAPGDILMTAAGTIGKSYLHSGSDPACYAGYLVRFRTNQGCDPRFVAYWMQSADYWAQVEAGAVRSTIDNFSAGKYRNVLVPSPSLAEQRRIADFLDDQVGAIDRAIDEYRLQAARIEERATVELEALVTGNTRVDSFSASWPAFGHVPSAWRQTRLRSIPCFVQTGPFGSQLHSEEYVDDGWPVINPANLRKEGIVRLPRACVDDATRHRLSRHVLRQGDLVFGRRGELGRAGLVDREQQGWVCGTGSLLVRLMTRDMLMPEYLLRLLRTSALRYFFDTQAVGSTMANLNTGILMAMPLLLPALYEQRRIVATAQEVELLHRELGFALEQEMKLLEERRRALITAAVTGEFDVSTASPRAAAAVTG